MVTEIKITPIDYPLDEVLEQVIASKQMRQSDLEDVGIRFGLYEAMGNFGPVSVGDLAGHTGLSTGALVAWLGSQLAVDAIAYEMHTDRYSLWSTWPPLR